MNEATKVQKLPDKIEGYRKNNMGAGCRVLGAGEF